MKNLQQKGFTALETVLLLFVIGLIVGVGWWVYSQNKKTDSSTTSQQTTQETATSTRQAKVLEIKEWGVKVTVGAPDPIYKIQDNLVYLSTASVENSAECKEVRKTVPEYMHGMARHTNITDKLYVQAPGEEEKTVDDALKSSNDNVKKVGDNYYEYFHGNGIDCTPTEVDYGLVFKSLTQL